MNSNNNLEPRRDLPLHKIPELLAKITGTFSSSISSTFEIKSQCSTIDRCEEYFHLYSNGNSKISVDGLLRFCTDLSLAPDSYEFLLFCFLCRAEQMYSLTREEFVRGWKTLGEQIENLDEFRRILFQFDLKSLEKEFYLWTFHFGLNDGQRCLTTRNAIDLWKLFYSKSSNERSTILDQWFEYLEEDMINDIPKMITCDTWKIFPQFISFIQLNDFHSYDDNEVFHCNTIGSDRNKMSKPNLTATKGIQLKPLQFDKDSIPNKRKIPIQPEEILLEKERNASRSNPKELSTGTLRLAENQICQFTANDLIDRGVIGEGNFGIVSRMEHRSTGTMMAVKKIRSTVDERCQKQMLNELDIVMRENNCPHIVQFYGALFKEGDCLICMELMDSSLDRFYKFVYHKLDQFIPESVLVYITFATLQALDYIKSRWKIIHRDVKPSNILVSRKTIKLCDFGISGQLIDSIAKTRDAGCRPYLPPERIDPTRATRDGYDVRSDVWSLGITLYEIATGYFPFREWTSFFDQLDQVVEGPPLRLTIDRLSDNCRDFVNTCLNKDENQRPKYQQLLQHPFLDKAKEAKLADNVAAYFSDVLDGLAENRDTFKLYYYLPQYKNANK